MTYLETIQQIATNLSETFSEIYHSAEIVSGDNGLKFPAIANGDRWENLAPNDGREIIYIRSDGDDFVNKELKIGSCVKAYTVESKIRIVYFKDHTDNHNNILLKLLQGILVKETRLRGIVRDKWKLQKSESSGNYNFGGSTAYFAIDIIVVWDLQPDNCLQDCCTEIDNPIKKSNENYPTTILNSNL